MEEKARWLAKTNRSVPMKQSGQPAAMTEDEERGYTDQASKAMPEEPEPVSLDELKRQQMEARRVAVERREGDENERVEAAKRQVRSVTEQLREVAVAAAKAGKSLQLWGEVKRAIERERRRL